MNTRQNQILPWFLPRFLGAIIIVFLGINNVYTQAFSFKRLNVKDGLSQSAVLDITKDSQGLMWFATRYGLNRYDGVRFKVYENRPSDTSSISNNYINNLFRDAKNQLWIGSQGGLDRYNSYTDSFSHYYFYEGNKKTHGISVLKITEDQNQNLWVGTNQGLFILPRGQTKCIKLKSTPAGLRSDVIHELFVDHNNKLWATSPEGIHQLQFDGTALKSCDMPEAVNDIKGHIRSILQDKDHNFWFGSETQGLYRLSSATGELRQFRSEGANTLLHSSIRKLLASTDGRLFIGTQDGVSILDLATFDFSNEQNDPKNPNSLSQNSIYALYLDDQRSLWVGTYFGGVNLAYGIDTKFERRTINSAVRIPHNVIRPITEDQNKNIWVGTEGGGVFSTDQSLGNVKSFYNHEQGMLQSRSNFVKTLLVDRANEVWVGTSGGGLYHLDATTGKYTLVDIHQTMDSLRMVNIMSLYHDKQGRYWVFGEGYNRILKRQDQTFHDVTPPAIRSLFTKQSTVKILESRDNNLWILTTNNLYKYNTGSGKITRLLAKQESPVHAYNCLLEDHRGFLWLGVDYEGLKLIDPRSDSVVRRYTSKDGLSSDNVVGLLEDSYKNIWITTTRGLSRLNSDRERIQNYTYQDGLADEEFNYNSTYITKTGKVLLGSLGGLTWFMPANIQVNDTEPSIIFTGLKLFGDQTIEPVKNPNILSKNITQRPHLTFSSSEHVFTIQFALNNYIKPSQNRFMYRLEGENSTWSTLDKAEVSFSNLAYGTYVLSVKGSNSDGVWSKPSTLSFTVNPPIYLSWWALLIYASLLCLLLFFVLRYIFLREILVREEQLHQTKLNFFSMVSHEIRSHLSLIIIPIDNALDKVDNTYARQQLENASNNSKRLLRLSSELIDFRKAETSIPPLSVSEQDIIPFIHEILDSFKQAYQEQDISIQYIGNFKSCLVQYDPLQLEKVLFNLLNNAVKHSSKGSKISLKDKIENDHLFLSLTNQGEEIPTKYLERIFEQFFQVNSADRTEGFGLGLSLSKQIMQMHRGDIYAASADGLTTFTIVLPITGNDNASLDPSPPLVSNEHILEPVHIAINPPEPLMLEADKPTILIIEDNPDLRKLMYDLLSELYHTHTAINGAQGIAMAREHMPDLIISDIMMPIKDGMQVCSELKADITTSHIPIVLLTARTTEKDIVEGLDRHADLYLTKPINKRVLMLQIRNLLRAAHLLQKKYRQEYIIEPTKKVVNNVDEQFLVRLVQIIEEGIDSSNYDVDFLASEVGMSNSVLYKKVKSLTGMTVNEFAKSIRLKKAALMLAEQGASVSQAASYVGFLDSKYFSREFKKQFGISPSQYSA